MLSQSETAHHISYAPFPENQNYPASHQRINNSGPYNFFGFRCNYLVNYPGYSLHFQIVSSYLRDSSSTTYQVHTVKYNHHTQTIKMPASAASAFNPRQRLSIFTNSTLGHDVSAAFKASSGLTSRSSDANETPAPPPSPVDFCFPITPADSRRGSSGSN